MVYGTFFSHGKRSEFSVSNSVSLDVYFRRTFPISSVSSDSFVEPDAKWPLFMISIVSMIICPYYFLFCVSGSLLFSRLR